MTVQQKNFVKNNFPMWINLTTLTALLSFIIYQSRWQEKVDTHISDQSLHISFEKRIQIFVPRVEIDARLSNIASSQEKLDKKQDQILEILMFGTK